MKKVVSTVLVTMLLTVFVFIRTDATEVIMKKIEVAINNVKIFANGHEVSEDNFVYNGTTYVPLRAVSESLGMVVYYDGANGIINIEGENTNSQKVKIYAEIMNHYKRSGDLYEMLSDTSESLFLSSEGWNQTQSKQQFIKAQESLNKTIDFHNNLITITNKLEVKINNYNENLSSMDEIFSKGASAIDNYKKAFNQLDMYIETGKDSYFDNYLEYQNQGFYDALEAESISFDEYMKYYNKLLNS
ncbi:copper amine oxidase N-terminal domain-containing protein [Filobacillus milosensis]|uniref:Copper amine oxidase N-terminal domain-containing protein n=1 Tax=Filobacillus milosensis TaxID=94137 RepID=A0A4Y8ICM6_9BACI|nr:copper amine oxidase N-terminal domain-containing protein [Filobacillus milosensis]TFB13665.1 copper amine oxidase N-terminal domain-containing protein [Filobacillus milosensis]